ncbi:MAG: polyprenyl diphosphate synthase, partial [Bacillota bacterium]
KLGIEHITVYAFSTENWKRSEEEIGALMNILRDYCSRFLEQFLSDDIAIHIIGDVSALDLDIQEMLEKLEAESVGKTGMTVHIALNYGGRDELLRGVKSLAKLVEDGTLSSEEITEDVIAKCLDTKGVPDPELLIRTSGEERISNFLLWQIAYSELYFTDELWPDFDETSLLKAIISYQNRSRRFGGR